jgi:hypothetical protein
MTQHHEVEKAAEHLLAHRRRSASRRSVCHSLPSSAAGVPRCREAAISGAAKLRSWPDRPRAPDYHARPADTTLDSCGIHP